MSTESDPRQRTSEALRAIEPSHLWMLGLAIDEDGLLVGPGKVPYSYWADCECPDDCLRDHENE